MAVETEVVTAPDTTPSGADAATSVRPASSLPALIPWAGLVVGSALLVIAYQVASERDGDGKFVWFWIGFLAFVLPLAWRLAATTATNAERLALLAAYGLFSYLPRLLRGPDGPLFFDELAHWVQAERLAESGTLFQANTVVPLAGRFPGLHVVAAGLHDLTGLSIWHSAVLLVALLHVAGVLGVFVLARQVTHRDAVAGLAGLLYGLNPGFLFFNAQFAYQSLAIALVIWALVATLEGLARPRATRRPWLLAALLLALACTVTHHLSSGVLLVGLVILATASEVRARRDGSLRGRATDLWVLTAAIAAIDALWLGLVARDSFTYLYELSPLSELSWSAVRAFVTGDAGRGTFGESGLPAVERLVAFGAPLVAVVAAASGAWTLRHRLAERPGLVLAVALGSAYVLSLPLLFSVSGQEGARRSWPFDYLGVAVLAAAGALTWLLAQRSASARHARFAGLAFLVGIAVLAVGNVASDSNGYTRFPGPWRSGVDSRHLTPELEAATGWFRGEAADETVVADLYSRGAFAALGRATTVSGEPVWELYGAGGPTPRILRTLARENVGYVVVDRRSATEVPRLGYYFSRSEPGADTRVRPLPRLAITQFERVPWATKVYSNGTFDVYRVDFTAAVEEQR